MPNKLVVANQKGGVAKTTTSLAFGQFFATHGVRTLIVDTDPQGSVSASLGLHPAHDLHDFIVRQFAFDICRTNVMPNLDILPGSKETTKVDVLLGMQGGNLFTFRSMFAGVENNYDLILFDCAPSISVVQSAALVYTERLLIPVSMEILAVQGALSCLETALNMNEVYKGVDVKPLAMLPVKVDRRLQATRLTFEWLEKFQAKYKVPVLPGIRTDEAVQRASRSRQMLGDFAPRSKAWEDYSTAASELAEILNVQFRESAPTIETQVESEATA